jgi:hypothetical protein
MPKVNGNGAKRKQLGERTKLDKHTFCKSAIHGLLGPIFHPNDKANMIANCLQNQFRSHELCDYDHRQYVEAKVEALLATVMETTKLSSDPATSQKKYNP